MPQVSLPQLPGTISGLFDPTYSASTGRRFANGQQDRNTVFRVESVAGSFVVKKEPYCPNLLDTLVHLTEVWQTGALPQFTAPIHLSVVADPDDGNKLKIRTVYPLVPGHHPEWKSLTPQQGKALFARTVPVMLSWPSTVKHQDIHPTNLIMSNGALVFIDPTDVSNSGGCLDHFRRTVPICAQQQTLLFHRKDLQPREYEICCLFYSIFVWMVGLNLEELASLVTQDKEFVPLFPRVSTLIAEVIAQANAL
jgi:hypothetical protein